MDVTSKNTASLSQKAADPGQSNLLARLVRPHPRIQDEEQKARSRFLAVFMLAAAAIGIIIVLMVYLTRPNLFAYPDTVAAGVACIFTVGAFLINRAGYTNAAAMMMILILGATFTIPPFMEGSRRDSFFYVALPILVTATFFSRRAVIAVSLFIAGAAYVLSQFSSTFMPNDVSAALQYVALIAATAAAMNFFYRTREQIRQEQFQKINNELDAERLSLEQKVGERTRDLATVTQVNAQISTILETERLMQDVVDLTKERFRLYHAHIYLLNDDEQKLVLASGAGHVGRQMVSQGREIGITNTRSIVAEAARNRQGVIINDVTESPTFLPNPLLPDTASELAVPLVARGQLLGVLDVQSDKTDYFNDEVLSVMELMAGQIATAISNAQLYEVASRTSRHEKAVGNINRKIQSAVDMDDILQTTVRELGKALRVPYTAIELQVAGDTANNNSSQSAQE